MEKRCQTYNHGRRCAIRNLGESKVNKKDFLKLISQQRDKKTEEKFNGTLIDYVELVQANPSIAKLAHKRL